MVCGCVLVGDLSPLAGVFFALERHGDDEAGCGVAALDVPGVFGCEAFGRLVDVDAAQAV